MKQIHNILLQQKSQNILFFIILILLFIFHDFQNILFFQPQGIHFIRQTDSLSFVTGYYKFGMNFFEPKGLNLESINGRGASEFPILYYLTALIYFVVGKHEFILRLINIIIVSVGFFYLFRMIKEILQSLFYAYILSFLLLSSTVLLYYTNNFLPDTPALGITLIGWFYINKYITHKRKSYLVISFALFTLASLLKVSFLINPIAAFLALLIDAYLKNNKEKDRHLSILGLSFMIALIINLLWVIFVLNYNESNGNTYFNTKIRPIWNLDIDEIKSIWSYIINYWYSKYYFQSTFHLFLVITLVGSLYYKKNNRHIFHITLLLFLGTVFYILFFYEMFKDHDYYFIAVMPSIIFVVLASFQNLYFKFNKFINNFFIKILFLVICVLSLNYSHKKLTNRYLTDEDIYSKSLIKIKNIESDLDKLRIEEKAKFIVLQDQSRSGSLYFINRQGWILSNYKDVTNDYFIDCIDKGAEYLLILNKNELPKEQKDLLADYTLFNENNGMLIYKLNKTN